MKNNIVLIGAGAIGQAIARRASTGRHVLPADLRQDNLDEATFIAGSDFLMDGGVAAAILVWGTCSKVSARSGAAGQSRKSVSRYILAH